jgi:hypothetical protein
MRRRVACRKRLFGSAIDLLVSRSCSELFTCQLGGFGERSTGNAAREQDDARHPKQRSDDSSRYECESHERRATHECRGAAPALRGLYVAADGDDVERLALGKTIAAAGVK